jgi:hypothetical protein
VDATALVILADALVGPDDDVSDDAPEDAADEDAEEVDTCVLVYASPMIVKVYGSPENDMVSYLELHWQLS